MFGRGPILALAALGFSLSLSIPVRAQRGARAAGGRTHAPRDEIRQNQATTPIDEFETLAPEQQQKALNRLPQAERQKLQERLDRFNALPAQEQQSLKTLYNRLHQLPPERQDSVRKALNKFSQQSPGRQQIMRDELRMMAALPESGRATRAASPSFRSRFSKKEQEILRDMTPLLPAR